MWTQQKRCKGIVNSLLWKNRTLSLQRTIVHKENPAREQLLQKNYKNVSQPKDFNNNTDTSNIDPPKATIARHLPKVNSVRFEDPYEHIDPTENTHEYTHIIVLKSVIDGIE